MKLTPSTYSSRDRTGKVSIVLITFGLPYWYPNRAIGVVFIGLIAAGMLSSRADVGHVPYVTVWAKPSLPLFRQFGFTFPDSRLGLSRWRGGGRVVV